MCTSTLPLMSNQSRTQEPSEFPEETNTSTSFSSALQLNPLPNKPKSSSQNKTNTRTWSMSSSRRERTPQMSVSLVQLPVPQKSHPSTSSSTTMEEVEPVELEALEEMEEDQAVEVGVAQALEEVLEEDQELVEDLAQPQFALHLLLTELSKLKYFNNGPNIYPPDIYYLLLLIMPSSLKTLYLFSFSLLSLHLSSTLFFLFSSFPSSL